MSQHRNAMVKKPALSNIITKGFDAFNASKELYHQGAGKKPESGKFSKEQLAPLHRNFSGNPERAARQEAFVNKYMPHLKGLSAIQSGMEKVARGMLGIPDKPKKTTSAAPHWQDMSKVERKTSEKHGVEKADMTRAQKNESFIRNHAPHLSPLLSMQNKLQDSFRSIMGLPTKTPDKPTVGQKIDKTQTADNESREQRSPMARLLDSKDPDRAARQQAFLDKYMPHVAALSKLQSSLEGAVRDAIKGPKDSSVDPKAGVGATN